MTGLWRASSFLIRQTARARVQATWGRVEECVSLLPNPDYTTQGTAASLFVYSLKDYFCSRDAVLQAYNPFETDCKCCQPKIERCDNISVDMTCANNTVLRGVKIFSCSAFECGCATCKP